MGCARLSTAPEQIQEEQELETQEKENQKRNLYIKSPTSSAEKKQTNNSPGALIQILSVCSVP